jgi:hypothetical protein
MLCFVFIINCKTNNKSLGIVVSTARKINLVVFIERADGDAGRWANEFCYANGGLDDGFDGGANDGHFY